MKVRITSIACVGDLSRERLILKASDNDDIGDYVVFRTQAAKKDRSPLSMDIPNAFWFPDLDIKMGDFIVLYTKVGVRSTKPAADGTTTSHFFYWGLTDPIWASSSYRAVLLHIENYQVFKEDGPEE
jgi:hypothetical protein